MGPLWVRFESMRLSSETRGTEGKAPEGMQGAVATPIKPNHIHFTGQSHNYILPLFPHDFV